METTQETTGKEVRRTGYLDAPMRATLRGIDRQLGAGLWVPRLGNGW
jgi:hypothetical protein